MKQYTKGVFQDILYAQCWEDPSLDRAAFNITAADTVFSITSGGCNVLAFLIDRPKRVIALDINPYQNFLLDLKIAAFRSLTYDELLEFVGVRESCRRWELYVCLRPLLTQHSRRYWDKERAKIADGIINCGRYERYMALLRRWLHRLMGRELIDRLYANDDPCIRNTLYDEQWNNPWWKLFTRVLLSRTTMSLLFDKAFFAQIDESFSFGKHFAERTRRALTVLPIKQNYFLSYILLGHFYDENSLPPYLRVENFGVIRSNLDNIEIVTSGCDTYFSTLPDSCITKFNFTNIFEWMSPEDFELLLRQTCRVAANDAVITYRNLLVRRERPASLATQIEPDRPFALGMHARDLSFIYSNYVVERIIKRDKTWTSEFARDATGKRGEIFSASRL